MARLYRPHVPLEVRCRVALRQLGEMWPDQVLDEVRANYRDPYRPRSGFGAFLEMLLAKLAELLGCVVEDLRLDHDPPLALRESKLIGLTGRRKYMPDANDPEHLAYRPHGAEFAGSHDVKTRIRGEHGQFSDVQLIKRRRRRERKAQPVKRRVGKRAKIKAVSKWPKGRKLQGRGTWPKRTGHK